MPAPATDPARAIGAGFLYFAPVFALGFVLGVARTLLLDGSPGVSRLAAVALELPLMLGGSWLACAFVVRRLDVSAEFAPRLLMGASAFVLLMAAEIALGVFLGGRTLGEHVALYGEPSYQLGLAGQLLFALIPVIQRRAP